MDSRKGQVRTTEERQCGVRQADLHCLTGAFLVVGHPEVSVSGNSSGAKLPMRSIERFREDYRQSGSYPKKRV